MENSSEKAQEPISKVDEEEEHFRYAWKLASSSTLPMVLLACFQLEVFDIIAKAGPGAKLSAQEIATEMPITHQDNPAAAVTSSSMLDRMLRLLSSYSILTCCSAVQSPSSSSRLYGLAPVAKYFVRNQDGASLGSLMAMIQDKVYMDSWYQLKNAVLDGGIPFDRVHGMSVFEYHGTDGRFSEVFNKSMADHSIIVVKKILERYKGFEQIQVLVDVGGGLGITIGTITAKYPSIQGINFDLPHVIKHAPSYPGVKHVGGNMFESVPKGDAMFMKWILHDWSDDHCLKLLKNCYKALTDNGKVIVVEAILPEVPDTSAGTQSSSQCDMLMMTLNQRGKERTEQEFLALATGAGFKGIRMECFPCNFCVMEFYK